MGKVEEVVDPLGAVSLPVWSEAIQARRWHEAPATVA